MEYEDVPLKDAEWIRGLKYGSSTILNDVHDAIITTKDVTELKARIIFEMTELIAECADVIKNANSMEDDRICTCKEKHGDLP